MFFSSQRRCSLRPAVFCLVLFAVFLSCSALLLPHGRAEAVETGAADALSAKLRRVRVGFFAHGNYHRQDEQGRRGGYGYDFLQLLNNYNDWDYEYVGYGTKGWQDMLDMLERGELDLVTSAVKTPEREERFAFSDLPMGRQRLLLVARQDDRRFRSTDPDRYQGLRVGAVRGSRTIGAFNDFQQMHGFRTELVLLDSLEEQREALRTSRVDAVLVSNLAMLDGERILEVIAEEPIYAIVNKNDTTLLAELNKSLDALNNTYPEWQFELTQEHFPGHLDEFVPLTLEDHAYLAKLRSSGQKLQVLVMSDVAPYAYMDQQGEMRGILPDLFKKLAHSLYLPYEMHAAANEEQLNKMMQDADIVLAAPHDMHHALAFRSFKLTRELLGMPMARITRDGVRSKVNKIAVPWHLEPLLRDNTLFPQQAQLIIYPSVADCAEAVRDRQCDATYLGLYAAQDIILHDERNILKMNIMPELQLRLSLAINRRHSYHLAKLFNVALANLDEKERRNIESSYMSPAPQRTTLMGFIYAHPLTVMGIAALLFLCVIGVQQYMTNLKLRHNQLAMQYAYTDRRSGGLPNRHWFEVNAFGLATQAMKQAPERHLYVGIIALNRAGILLQNFGRKFVAAQLARILQALRDENDNVHAIALSSSGGRIFLLFSLPPEADPDCWLNKMMEQHRDAVLPETELHTEQHVVLNL